jgi:Uma2 family endonuclease
MSNQQEADETIMTMTADVEQPAASDFPLRAPFSVDLLFDLPVSNERYEVLEGQLVVSPAPEPRHNLAADRLRAIIDPLLPDEVEAITGVAVRMPNQDGPIPDLLVTTADPEEWPRGISFELVHSVVEVVSPSHPTIDRAVKKELYAAAGIPCYWRIEPRPWRGYRGPVPAIVVRMLGDDGEWRETIHPAGLVTAMPLAIGRGGPEIISVKFDPGVLVGPRRRYQ